MKPPFLTTCLITIATLLLTSCDKRPGSIPAASPSETLEGTIQTKLRAGGFELTTTGLRTSYAPQDNDKYAEFLIQNISDRMLPFQAAVGTGFDQSHQAVFISIAEFTDENGAPQLSINHNLARTAAPKKVEGPAIDLPPGKTIHLALRVGQRGSVTDAEWKVSRPQESDLVFVIHGIPGLFK